eukprot:6175867-Pleurochrysis_carterae.AAC.4
MISALRSILAVSPADRSPLKLKLYRQVLTMENALKLAADALWGYMRSPTSIARYRPYRPR